MRLLLDMAHAPPSPRLTLLGFVRGRDKFTHATETLAQWMLLGVQAGVFRYRLGTGEPGLCHPGDFVLCPPGVSLAREMIQKANFYTMRFHWKPARPAAWQGKWTMRDEVRFASTLEKMQVCTETHELRAMMGWANHLLTDLLCQMAMERQGATPTQEAPDVAMLKAEEMLRDLSEAVTLEGVAEMLRISPFQLSRRFRAAFGQPPSVYRTQLRIQKARQLLRETDWKTDRIAEVCGFENAFYFSRVFTKQVGQAPRDFRREHRV